MLASRSCRLRSLRSPTEGAEGECTALMLFSADAVHILGGAALVREWEARLGGTAVREIRGEDGGE
eukprot:7625688-Pyramimonas_sp.AAC.1